MISDIYQTDLERHLFAPSPSRRGRERRARGDAVVAGVLAWLAFIWAYWDWR